MDLDCKELERLKELVPYKILAPTPNEIINYIEQLQSNWNSLRKENKALRLLLNWAEECDWGFDNFRDDDVINWEEFEKETEDMGYVESMIYYAKKYLEMNELEGKDKE